MSNDLREGEGKFRVGDLFPERRKAHGWSEERKEKLRARSNIFQAFEMTKKIGFWKWRWKHFPTIGSI